MRRGLARLSDRRWRSWRVSLRAGPARRDRVGALRGVGRWRVRNGRRSFELARGSLARWCSGTAGIALARGARRLTRWRRRWMHWRRRRGRSGGRRARLRSNGSRRGTRRGGRWWRCWNRTRRALDGGNELLDGAAHDRRAVGAKASPEVRAQADPLDSLGLLGREFHVDLIGVAGLLRRGGADGGGRLAGLRGLRPSLPGAPALGAVNVGAEALRAREAVCGGARGRLGFVARVLRKPA